MTAGLPGIGIGGVFYLTCGLLMPFVELFNSIRGKFSKKRWQLAGVQFSFSCAILISFWLTGIGLGNLLDKFQPATHSSLLPGYNAFHIQNVFISLGLLALVLCGLQVVNFLLDLKKNIKVFRQIKRWYLGLVR